MGHGRERNGYEFIFQKKVVSYLLKILGVAFFLRVHSNWMSLEYVGNVYVVGIYAGHFTRRWIINTILNLTRLVDWSTPWICSKTTFGHTMLLSLLFFLSADIFRIANVVLCEVRTITRSGKLS